MSEHSFQKVLGRTEVLTLSLGAIIGWGWVVLTGGFIMDAGSLGTVIAFVLSAVIFYFIGLTYAELAAAMPKVGGEHVYSHKALGKHASFICTWSLTLTYVSVVALQAAAMPVALEYFFPDMKYGYLWTFAGYEVYLSYVVFGILTTVAITGLNILGIKLSASFQNFAVVLILLLGFVFAGGAFFGNGSTENLQPLVKNGMTGIFPALVVIPFLLVGFDVIPQTAEEIKVPPRQMARLLLFSIFIAIAWYIMVVWALGLSLPPDQLERASFSVAEGAAVAWGSPLAGKLVIFCGIIGILTSWNAFMIGGSRAIFAMAESKMLPRGLTALSKKHRSPYNALIMIAVVAIISTLMGRQAMIFFVNAGSFSLLFAYFLVAVSFLVLRKKFPDMERPYFVRFGRLTGILAAVLSIGLAILFLPGMPAALGGVEWLIVLIWFVLGGAFYAWALVKYK
jgi:APA family basic amino acid/polyamine antiporter